MLRWWLVVLLWFSSCAVAAALWDGMCSRERSFEQLLEDSRGTVNVEAAIGRLREKVLSGVRAIRDRREDPERAGSLATNALLHIAEATK